VANWSDQATRITLTERRDSMPGTNIEDDSRRQIGRSGLAAPPLGFGAFKIGRNIGVKYTQPYELPDETFVSRLLNGVLDLGCTLIDTAPAYGDSEARIGQAIGHRRSEFVLSTKVGETFENGRSRYDFSPAAVRASLEQSLRNLRTDILDIVLIHSDGDDRRILQETDTVSILQDFRSRGIVRAIGLSGKTVAGAELALSWADVVMVQYHLQDTSHGGIMQQAAAAGVAVFVKKGLSSGTLPPDESIRFVLGDPAVTSLIVGGLNLDHFRENWQTALSQRAPADRISAGRSSPPDNWA
jgi:aryl-alcohol dehydrogenase-like predicted oxidoreductase